MLMMILKMTAATLLYVAITAGLWLMYRKKERIGTGMKVLVGLVYGACSVVANHIGINFGMLVLNVRDIGPLAAGLFFSPLSGVIAGVIGGGERILAGELWDIGRFTEIACGMSTCLAGLLAALLYKKAYEGERPPVPQAFFLGAVMEVFHMYAVLFTNRKEIAMAYEVVQTAAIPMIIFTAIGLALCSAVVMKLSGGEGAVWLHTGDEETPLAVHFQRRLTLVTVTLFLVNFLVTYSFQTRIADENASQELQYLKFENQKIYEDTGSIEVLKKHLDGQVDTIYTFCLVDIESCRLMHDTSDTTGSGAEGELLDREDVETAVEHAGQEPFKMSFKTDNAGQAICCSTLIGENAVMMILRPLSNIYQNRGRQIYEDTLSDILIFTVLYVLVAMLVDKLVVRNLTRVNASLNKITNGQLEEKVWVRSSAEFTELSGDINQTVDVLKDYISQAEKRMQEELKLAATIQDSALPKNFDLPSENIEVYALMKPAKQVGGDFYDFFYAGRDKLCLVIADVSGKGVPAALIMMRAKTAIKNYARGGHGPAKVLERVNNALCEGNDAEMFVTVWLGILDPKTGKMSCANAGHEYPVLMRAGGDYDLVKDKHGLVLAAMENIPMKEYEIQMSAGDRLLVYTDGVPEAINEKEEAYGTERLIHKLNQLKNVSQEQALESVLRDIRNFAGNAEQFDDITMLGITYVGEVPDEARSSL